MAPVNDPPVANTDNTSGTAGTTVSFDVSANDTDPDGDTLTVLSNTAPTNGTVIVAGNGSYTYTPTPGFDGVDSFTYIVSDGNGGTDTQTVTITINGVNDAPVFASVTDPAPAAEVAAGTQVITATDSIVVNDEDAADTLTMTEFNSAVAWSGGAAPAPLVTALNGTAITFDGPFPSASGANVTFTYTYTAAAQDLNFLALGETLTISKGVQVTDATDTVVAVDTVDIVITGTNDGPVVTTAAAVAGANITFTVTDADTNDTLSLVGGPINGTDAAASGVATSITAIAQGVATTDAIEVQDNNGASTGVLLNLTQGTAGGDVLGVTANGVAGAVFGFGGADNIIGSALNDTIDGGTGADSINAGSGDDSVIGGDGDAIYAFDRQRRLP